MAFGAARRRVKAPSLPAPSVLDRVLIEARGIKMETIVDTHELGIRIATRAEGRSDLRVERVACGDAAAARRQHRTEGGRTRAERRVGGGATFRRKASDGVV